MVNHSGMTQEFLEYAALAGMAIGLIVSIYTDIRYRKIFNVVTLGIALLAPVYWYATGDIGLANIGIHLAIAVVTFILFAVMFHFRMMGGGDVKLFAALSLWFDWVTTMQLILFATLIGAFVTIFFMTIHKLRQGVGRAQIPYGVAIALAGLWVAGERFFNHFG